MAKEVIRYEDSKGCLHKREEDANEADEKYALEEDITPLVEAYKLKLGSTTYTKGVIKFILNHRKELKDILK